ncbi:MAG: DNA repair protein RecN [Edaphocola sp.]
MLQKIYIRNYAIIDELEILFDKGLNVITGETGAGKSIILGALSLILGERADTSVLIDRDEKSVVEAVFHTEKNEPLNRLLAREELDKSDTTIIRREISPAGKSRAFVNDTPVTLNVLNEITSLLVDLHRQFDNRAIEENEFSFEVLDAMAGNQHTMQRYAQQYKAYRQLEHECQLRLQATGNWQKEADYKQFLYDELHDAAFKENEIEDAAQTIKQLGNAEQIVSTLQYVYGSLEEGEQPLDNELKKLAQSAQAIANVQPGAAALADRLQSIYVELKDIANEANNLAEHVEQDPTLLQQLEERMNLGYRLFKKHGVSDTAGLLEIYAQLAKELEAQNNSGEQLAALQQTLDKELAEVAKLAQEIHDAREKAAPGFAGKINQLLALIGMPNATIQIAVNESNQLHAHGNDRVTFLLDANKSGQSVPVQKAASGGEMSRIMLCIKSLTAQAMNLPTLIFDEVDTGISGEAARQVGTLLKSLGLHHQIICITHQPQVAGKGTRHFYVYKTATKEGNVKTRVKVLAAEERIKAIAQMIGGDVPSEAALNNARELVN